MKDNYLAHIKMLRYTQKQLDLPDDYMRPLVWENTNEAILAVDQEGNVQAKEKGYATVSVKDVRGQISRWRIEVAHLEKQPEVETGHYFLIYKKWLANLVGDQEESTYKNLIIKKITRDARVWWERLDVTQETLWEDELTEAYATNPLHLHTHYRRLEDMAKGYQLPGSSCYQNKELLRMILEGMEWLYQKGYHERKQYGNWWEWEIGIPKTLINLCVLLREELGEKLIRRYTDAIYYHQPDPFHMGSSEGSRYRYMEHQGANRVDTAVVAMGLGMLRQDYEQLILAKEAVESVLKLQQRQDGVYTDGFYSDGSFIQHSHVPYTGTYGGVLLEGAAHMIHMLKGTPWAIGRKKIEQLMQFTKIHFMPMIYKGAALDMVRGRAVARPHQPDRYSGAEIIASMAVLAEGLEEQKQIADLKAVIKTWIIEEQYRPILEYTYDFTKLACLEKISKDASIPSCSLPELHKHFPLMDRVIHRTEDFLFALSLHSQRISNYEKGGQTENPHGWHTADGMYYLYNTDLSHYSEQYWNTVNPYRLPGTTVDTQRLVANQGAAQKMASDWVGGVMLDEKNGSQGMWYKGNAFEQDLEAKKSWFMLGDAIICLGAAIQSKQGRAIETIIENRKLREEGTNKIVIGNIEKIVGEQEQVNVYPAHELHNEQKGPLKTVAKWMHLEGNVEGADIGYYFPEDSTEIYLEQVTRKGSWGAIYFDGDHQVHTRDYLEMWIDHGINPTEATYAYAILPGKTMQQMMDYIKSKPFTVIENTSIMQAVQCVEKGILGVNIWQTGGATLDEIKVDTPSAILLQKHQGILVLAIAEPTMQASGKIVVEINEGVGEIISQDERITIMQKEPKLQLHVDINEAMGQTIRLKAKLQ